MPNKPFVPPGGFVGFAQNSVAAQTLVRPKKKRAKRRRKKVAKKTTRKRTTKRKTKKKPARLVKGSAAAKRHMAKLRKMRK